MGFLSAARWYVDEYGKRSQVQVSLRIEKCIGRLPKEIEIALFRVLQESLTNVYRSCRCQVGGYRHRRRRWLRTFKRGRRRERDPSCNSFPVRQRRRSGDRTGWNERTISGIGRADECSLLERRFRGRSDHPHSGVINGSRCHETNIVTPRPAIALAYLSLSNGASPGKVSDQGDQK